MTSRNGSHRTTAICITSFSLLFLIAFTAEILKLGIDYPTLWRPLRWLTLSLSARYPLLLALSLLIEQLSKPVGGLGKLIKRLALLSHLFALQGLLGRVDGGLQGAQLGDRELFAILVEHLLCLIAQTVELIPDLDLLAPLLVFLGAPLGILDHSIDLVLNQSGAGSDRNLLFLAGGKVLGGHVEDPIGIDVERDLDLRNTARRRWNPHQVETAQRPTVPGQLPLPLEDVDLHAGLTIGRRREQFALAGRDGGVPFDQSSHHPTQGFDPQRKRCHVQEDNVFDVAHQYAGLNGGADRDHLIGIDPLMRLFPKQLPHQRLNLRHPGLAADQP